MPVYKAVYWHSNQTLLGPVFAGKDDSLANKIGGDLETIEQRSVSLFFTDFLFFVSRWAWLSLFLCDCHLCFVIV